MLTITDSATDLIRRLAQERAVPAGGGLRIARRHDHPALTMYLTDRPGPGDVVLRKADARVFLAPAAAARLTKETLDARTNDIGAAFFLD